MGKNKKSLAELLTALQGELKKIEGTESVVEIVAEAVNAQAELVTELTDATAKVAELEKQLEAPAPAAEKTKELEAQVSALLEANKELAEKLDLLSSKSAEGVATVTVGKTIYRAKNGRWLHPGRGYVTIADCVDNKELTTYAINKNILVAVTEGGKA